MDLTFLGDRIRTRRNRLGLRQLDLANALRVSAQAVSKWERGENAPDLTLLPGLARLLDVSIDSLLADGPPAGAFEATVMCTGLRGFAKRSSAVGAPQVAAWVNGIFVTLTEITLRYDCVPVKYVGDGFLGFFAGADHAKRAREAFTEAHGLLTAQGLVGVLSTGEVFLGSVGHPDYARSDIMGKTVNRGFMSLQWLYDCPHDAVWLGGDDAPCNWARIDHPGIAGVSKDIQIRAMP